jgi:hypothetical protein
MPIELKRGFDSAKYVRQAAERRAVDEEHVQFSQADVDRRTKATLALRVGEPTFPPIEPGGVLDARSWTDYVRDSKMNVAIVASTGNGLETEIKLNAQKNFAILDDLQREAQALDSYVTEEEVKINGRYSQVHYNSFVRARDTGLSYDDQNWLVDYKTGLAFQADNISDVIPGTGATLPLRQEISVPITNVVLVGEETDVGDTVKPIVSSEPRNLLRDDRVFRHVIMRTDHDETSRKYNFTPSYCTFLLEFASVQLVNTLTVRPLGHSTVYIESITYMNEAGEEVELTEVELPGEVELTVLFEPIRTQFMKVKFRQYAPVTRTHYNTSDLRVRELNRLLRGAGFSQLLNESGDVIQGRVYDFSMESVRVGLRLYENLGVFRSQPIKVEHPVGCSFNDVVETIQISNDQRTYGSTFFLNEGEVLLERYLGIDLKTPEGGQALYDLVPIPDARRAQREFLPLFSGEAQAKLFPDLQWNLKNKLYWDSSQWIGGWLYMTIEGGHGFDTRVVGEKQTDKLVAYAGPGEEGTAFSLTSTEWYLISATQLKIKPSSGGYSSRAQASLKISPFIYLENEQDDPLKVYKEESLLTFGSDYEISLDRGATWLSEWPRDYRWNTLRGNAKAGTFKIRLTNPDSTKLYFVDYKVLRNQQLSKRPGVNLSRGRVVFGKRLQKTSGTISTVIVSRADSVNPYLTPVLLSYFLKVREDVS